VNRDENPREGGGSPRVGRERQGGGDWRKQKVFPGTSGGRREREHWGHLQKEGKHYERISKKKRAKRKSKSRG